MAIMESFDADIHDNSFTNVKYGMRISLGGGNNNVYDNVFDQCSQCEYSSTVHGNGCCPRKRNHVPCINMSLVSTYDEFAPQNWFWGHEYAGNVSRSEPHYNFPTTDHLSFVCFPCPSLHPSYSARFHLQMVCTLTRAPTPPMRPPTGGLAVTTSTTIPSPTPRRASRSQKPTTPPSLVRQNYKESSTPFCATKKVGVPYRFLYIGIRLLFARLPEVQWIEHFVLCG